MLTVQADMSAPCPLCGTACVRPLLSYLIPPVNPYLQMSYFVLFVPVRPARPEMSYTSQFVPLGS